MVEHLVLFKWKEEATPAAIEQVLEGLRSLKTKVPGIVELTCGENFTARSKGYTHGLAVRLQDRASLEGYGPHPEHRKILDNYITPILADILALDYEF